MYSIVRLLPRFFFSQLAFSFSLISNKWFEYGLMETGVQCDGKVALVALQDPAFVEWHILQVFEAKSLYFSTQTSLSLHIGNIQGVQLRHRQNVN